MYTGGKITEVEIGGCKFYIRQFDPFRAISVLGDLQRVIAPVLGSIAGSIKKNGIEGDLADLSVIAGAMEEVFAALPAQLDGDKLQGLSKKLLQTDFIGVSVDGSKPVMLDAGKINEVFTGKPYDMLRLMYEVAKANYADFSMLSNIPVGLRVAFGETKSKFQANLTNLFNPKPSSGEPSTQE